jgi:hypothetical protein
VGEKTLNIVMATLIVLVAFNIWHQSELNKQQAERDRAYSCHARNDFKRLDLERWLYVLKVATPDAGLPAKERKRQQVQNEQFKIYITAADAQEDCTKPREDFNRPPVRLP